MKTFTTSAFLLTLVLGCVVPRTNTQVVDGRPKVLVKNAPKGAMLFVDGTSMGQADSYSGDPSVLLLEPGTHLVEVKAGDRLLFSQRVFLGNGEIRTISVVEGSR
jgi:hypothetical protein